MTNQTDWISRITAILALIISLLALGFDVYKDFRSQRENIVITGGQSNRDISYIQSNESHHIEALDCYQDFRFTIYNLSDSPVIIMDYDFRLLGADGMGFSHTGSIDEAPIDSRNFVEDTFTVSLEDLPYWNEMEAYALAYANERIDSGEIPSADDWQEFLLRQAIGSYLRSNNITITFEFEISTDSNSKYIHTLIVDK